MKVAGAVLIVLGLASLVVGGIPYRKTQNIARLGEFKMQYTEQRELTIPPLIGGIAILAGAALLFATGRKSGS